MQQHVTFRFGQDRDVRYLAIVPAIGDLVTHGNALWVVARVDVDAERVIVTCQDSTDGGRLSEG